MVHNVDSLFHFHFFFSCPPFPHQVAISYEISYIHEWKKKGNLLLDLFFFIAALQLLDIVFSFSVPKTETNHLYLQASPTPIKQLFTSWKK
jgi:hypothetical protein